MLDVVIGTDVAREEPVSLPYDDRDRSVAIVGKSQTGKSSILEHLILADLASFTPGMVIDPHGRLAQRICSAAAPEQARRIILLEATSDAPFGLNLLSPRKPVNENDDVTTWAVDTVVETIKKLYGEQDSYAPRLERYLRLAARTLIPAGRTLVDIPWLFEDEAFRHWCLSRVNQPLEAETLRTRWAAYERLRPADRVIHTEALLNRIDAIIDSPLLSAIVGSKETTVPFDRILSGQDMLIVTLPSETLGRERCDFIGSMLLCELANRVFSRSVAETTPQRLHLYLDEYQRFATATTAEFLEEGRKYNVGVTLAHQSLMQISDDRIRNASRHAATLIVLGVTRPDADRLAGEFPITPREEWVETITEVDGTEPKMVFSPTAAEDIYLQGHTNPAVDEVVRRFFAFSPVWSKERVMQELDIAQRNADIVTVQPDKRKSAGILPRGDEPPMDPAVQVEPYSVNELLLDAMEGKLRDTAALIEKLLWAETWVPDARLSLPEDPNNAPVVGSLHERDVSTMYYLMRNESPSMYVQEPCDCADIINENATHFGDRYTIGRDRPRRRDDPLGVHLVSCQVRPLSQQEEAYNGRVELAHYHLVRGFAEKIVRNWLTAYIDHQEELESLRQHSHQRPGRSFQVPDYMLMRLAWTNYIDGTWTWRGGVTAQRDGALLPEKRDVATTDDEWREVIKG